jgi:hypothetical protein
MEWMAVFIMKLLVTVSLLATSYTSAVLQVITGALLGCYEGFIVVNRYGPLSLTKTSKKWEPIIRLRFTGEHYSSQIIIIIIIIILYYFLWLCSPARAMGYGLLVSRGFLITHNDASVGLLWKMTSSSQRPLPVNTEHTQQTNIHAPGGIFYYIYSTILTSELHVIAERSFS